LPDCLSADLDATIARGRGWGTSSGAILPPTRMRGNGRMTAALDSAVAYHLGMVVHDLDAAAACYGRLLRVPRWHTLETDALRIGFGRGAGLTFELIQPRTPGTLWATFLETHGEGLQHLGFWVPDVQEAVAEAVAGGAVGT